MKQKNRYGTVFLCFVIAVLYIVFLKLVGYINSLFASDNGAYCIADVIGMAICAACLLILLYALKKQDILKTKGVGLLGSVGVSAFYIVTLCLASFQMILQLISEIAYGTPFLPINSIISFTLSMFFVGFTEELLFRGIIYNMISEAFGRQSRKQILLAVFFSGVIFGSMHISNVFSGVSLKGACFQAVAACGLGFYYAAIYERTHNFWFLVILHAYNDWILEISSGLLGIGSAAEIVSNYDISTLFPLFLYGALAMFLLRKKKLKLQEIEE